MGFTGSYTYQPGSVAQSQFSGPPTGVAAPGGLDVNLLKSLFDAKKAAADPVAHNPGVPAYKDENAAGFDTAMLYRQLAMQDQARDDARRVPAAAAAPTGKPIFTKTVGGPGMVGGTIRLNQWEPGAAFAGWERDLGSGPQNAAVQAPGMSRADLLADGDIVGDSRRVPEGAGGGGLGAGADFARGQLAAANNRSNAEGADKAAIAARQPIEARRLLELLLSGGNAYR